MMICVENRIDELNQNSRLLLLLLSLLLLSSHNSKIHVAQSAGAIEYTDCISAEGYSSNESRI